MGGGIGAIKTALWDSPKVKVKSLSRGRLFGTPRTVVYQAPLSMDFPGKNTGVGCRFLLQEIFPTQGLNPGLPHCRQTLYCLSHQGSLMVMGNAPESHLNSKEIKSVNDIYSVDKR